MDRTQRDGLLLVLLAAGGYAFFPILTKTLFDSKQFEPLDVLFLRFLLAAPITWVVMAWRRRSSTQSPSPQSGEGLGRGELPRVKLMLTGALFAFTAASAFFALERIPASTFTVVIYSYPAMVALLSLFLGERLSSRGWFALGLTVIGIILTVPDFGSGFTDMLGIIFTLSNAITYALYIVISGRLLRGHSDLTGASMWSITGTFVTMVVVSLLRGVNWPADASQWGSLIAMSVISTVIPIFAFYAGMQKLGAPRAAILSTVEPVFTLILAFLLLGERIETIQQIGAALILGSVILLQLGRSDQSAPAPAEAQADAV
jgi:drug/metabolite transporter (DMT)-like permease